MASAEWRESANVPGQYELSTPGGRPTDRVLFPASISNVEIAGNFQVDGTFTSTGSSSYVAPNGNPGGGFTFTTGNALSGNNNGGNFTVNLGAATGSGQDGIFQIRDKNNTQIFAVTTNAIGVGGGTPPADNLMYLLTTFTNPTQTVQGFTSNIGIALTNNNAQLMEAATFVINTDKNTSWNYTFAIAGIEADAQINGPGGNVTSATGGSFYPQTYVTSGATCTNMYGTIHGPSASGSGNVTNIWGAFLNPNIGTSNNTGNPGVDANVSHMYGFESSLQIGSTAATGGIVTTGYGGYIETPLITGTNNQAIQTVFGLRIKPQLNTASTGTAILSGGYVAYGGYFEVPTQGGNTSGTNNNYGFYINGSVGGVAGAGGTVNNWSFYNHSTIQSFFGGSVQINTGGLAVTAGGLTVTAGGATVTAGHLGVSVAASTLNSITATETFTDGGAAQHGVFATTTYALTADNANGTDSINGTFLTDTNAHNYTGTLSGVRGFAQYNGASGGTASFLNGGTFIGQVLTTSTGAVTIGSGVSAQYNHYGTGATATAYGVQSTVILRPSGGSVDGNITNAYAFYGRIENLSNDATPGVITFGYGSFIDVPAFGSGSPGAITTLYGGRVSNQGTTHSTSAIGFQIDVQANATNNTSLAIGTTTTGQWGIYCNTTNASFFGGLFSTYNNVATLGWGIAAIAGYVRPAQQVNTLVNLATKTVGAADGSFIVSANINVTVATASLIGATCTYTDETNTSRSLVLNFSNIAGVFATTTTLNTAGAFEGVPLHIRAKSGTTITLATTGTVTTATYTAEGQITQVA